MSKFFVGQRVKIVHSRSGKFSGREGVVIAVNFTGLVVSGEVRREALRVDIGEHLHVLDDPWRFEPLYDGNEPMSWESCLWQPTPERVQ